MEFCRDCGSYMHKSLLGDRVVFQCEQCQQQRDGSAADTLWLEDADVRESERFSIVLERAPHDPAAKTVPISCAKCGLQYMILARVGKAMRTKLVCECGNQVDYARADGRDAPEAREKESRERK